MESTHTAEVREDDISKCFHKPGPKYTKTHSTAFVSRTRKLDQRLYYLAPFWRLDAHVAAI